MSLNVTGTAVKGWRCEYSDDAVDVEGTCVYCYGMDFGQDGLELFGPGEFSHDKDDYVLGIAVASVGDYEDRVSLVDVSSEDMKLLEKFMERHEIDEPPRVYLVGNCS